MADQGARARSAQSFGCGAHQGERRRAANSRADARSIRAFSSLKSQARKQQPPANMTPEIGRAQTSTLVHLFGGRREPGVHTDTSEWRRDARDLGANLSSGATRSRRSRPRLFPFRRRRRRRSRYVRRVLFDPNATAMKAPVISVDYRLAPEHRWPAGLEDAIGAYRWVVARAERFGAPAGKAAVGGDSMGGNFSAIIAQEMGRAGAPAPVLQLLIYPATDIGGESGFDDHVRATLFRSRRKRWTGSWRTICPKARPEGLAPFAAA